MKDKKGKNVTLYAALRDEPFTVFKVIARPLSKKNGARYYLITSTDKKDKYDYLVNQTVFEDMLGKGTCIWNECISFGRTEEEALSGHLLYFKTEIAYSRAIMELAAARLDKLEAKIDRKKYGK